MEKFCAWDGDILVLNVLGKPIYLRAMISNTVGVSMMD